MRPGSEPTCGRGGAGVRRIRHGEHIVDIRMVEQLIEGLVGPAVRYRNLAPRLQKQPGVVIAFDDVGIGVLEPRQVAVHIGRRCAISVVGARAGVAAAQRGAAMM